jgi:hypothetical protein
VHGVGTVVFTVSASGPGVPVRVVWASTEGITSVAREIVTIARNSCTCFRARKSDLGQKQTSVRTFLESASRPKADLPDAPQECLLSANSGHLEYTRLHVTGHENPDSQCVLNRMI